MNEIPKEVSKIMDGVQDAGHEAFLIGGCVRDILLGRKPSDWDIATNAKPSEIEEIFEHTFYENEFGTVGVVNDDAEDETLKTVEVTTYRREGSYSDKRRPDEVSFSKNIEDDLERRDFTINAMALGLEMGERNPANGNLVDKFQGKNDLREGLIRAVGDAKQRFHEDALRIMRAVRFTSELGFEIEKETENAIIENREGLSEIANERIRDEFIKIIESNNPERGMRNLKKLSLLKFISEDLEKGIEVEQGGAHKFDVFEHSIRALQHAADREYSLEVRLAALFHDVAKPHTRRKRTEGEKEYSFFGHEVVGAKITKKVLENLKFSKDVIQKTTLLIRWHMFLMDTDQITLSAVRRLISNVGRENIWELMDLRTADRIGAGRPKERPYRLRKYEAMIEEALHSPTTTSDLKINGNDIMKELKIKPGPKVGWIMNALLEEVLDDPKRNTEEYLIKRSGEMIDLPNEELKKLGEAGKKKRDAVEEKEIEEIRKKYHVK